MYITIPCFLRCRGALEGFSELLTSPAHASYLFSQSVHTLDWKPLKCFGLNNGLNKGSGAALRINVQLDSSCAGEVGNLV